MAVTSIWHIKRSLSEVVDYALNPDKTKRESSEDILSDVINYAVNSDKTEETDDENTELIESYVTGINCFSKTAIEEMMVVKRHFNKTDGVLAYHGYQSFAPGEVTPDIAHKIGVKLAERLWGERYQVVVATHLDKTHHLHSHFVINNVSFVDGKKYYRSSKDYRDMWTISDELCREYGLSVLHVNPCNEKHKSYGEWRAEQEGRPTWRGLIKEDIDRCIKESMTDRQFFMNLKKAGYEVKIGKDISVRPPGKERFVRLARNFGENYTMDGIIKRILAQQRPSLPMPEYKPKPRFMKLRDEIKPRKKASGFRALYFHYCYLLGVFKRKKPQSNRKMHFLLKEDLIKMDKLTDEARLLGRNRIDTEQQLSSYKESLEVKLNELIPERRKLYHKQNEEGVKEKISGINKEIAVIRKELDLCDDIAVRSGAMKEKLKKIREDRTKETEQRKEKSRNDKLR